MEGTESPQWEYGNYILPYPLGLRNAYMLSAWTEITVQCDVLKEIMGTVEHDLRAMGAAGWELDEHEVICPTRIAMRRYGRSLGHVSWESMDLFDCLAGALTLGLSLLVVDCVEPQDFSLMMRRPQQSKGILGSMNGVLIAHCDEWHPPSAMTDAPSCGHHHTTHRPA